MTTKNNLFESWGRTGDPSELPCLEKKLIQVCPKASISKNTKSINRVKLYDLLVKLVFIVTLQKNILLVGAFMSPFFQYFIL